MSHCYLYNTFYRIFNFFIYVICIIKFVNEIWKLHVENYDKYQHATSEKKEYFVNLFYVHIKYTLLNTIAVCSWIHI